jgi:hypothetical protein
MLHVTLCALRENNHNSYVYAVVQWCIRAAAVYGAKQLP